MVQVSSVLLLVEFGDPGVAVDAPEYVRVLPEVALLVHPVLVPVDADDLTPFSLERAFVAVLILWALTPARAISTGAANKLTTEATSIAQKKEAYDGL